MALSSTTYSDGVLPALNTDANALSVCQFLDLETMDLDSDITNGLRDVTIQVNVAFCGPVNTPGKGLFGNYGFEGYIGTNNQVYALAPLPDAQNNYFHLFDCSIEKIDNDSIEVSLSVFFGVDTAGFLNEESGYSPAEHLSFTSINELSPFNITQPSVFREEREIVISVIVSNDQAFTFRKKVRARHFNKEYDGTIGTSVAGPLFELPKEIPETGDIPVTLIFNTSSITPDLTEYVCGIFRASDPVAGYDLVAVNNLVMRNSSSGQIDSRIPFAEITSMPNITDEGGGVFSVTVEVDRDFPVDGVAYYVFFLILDTTNSTWFPVISPASETDTVFPPTSGTYTVKLASYDMEEKIWETDCFAGVTPNERINVSIDMNKASYNFNIQTNELAGNWDENFKGVLFGLAQQPPVTIDDLLSISVGLSSGNITDNGNSVTAHGSGRIPESWAGLTGFFLFTFVFEINLGSAGRYTDYIVIPIRLIVNQFDDHPAGMHRLTLLGVVDENSDPIDPAICLDSAQRLIFSFQLSGVSDPADYVFIPYLKLKGTTAIQEFNTWDNQYLRRLEEEFFIAADQDFSNGGVATLEIDPQLLKIDSSYCVGAIAKGNTSVVDPPPALECPTFDIEVVHSSDDGNNFGFVFGCGVTLSNFSLPVTIEAFDVIIAADFGGLSVVGSFSAKGMLAGTFTDYISFIPVPNNVFFRYYITIVTVDSSKRYCQYDIQVDLLLSIQLGIFYENSTTIVGVTPD